MIIAVCPWWEKTWRKARTCFLAAGGRHPLSVAGGWKSMPGWMPLSALNGEGEYHVLSNAVVGRITGCINATPSATAEWSSETQEMA
jgi:hypothetical protein